MEFTRFGMAGKGGMQSNILTTCVMELNQNKFSSTNKFSPGIYLGSGGPAVLT